MTDRSPRTLLRRIDNAHAFPLVALQALRELREELETAEAQAILRARELGASLEDIAEAMEITRQGVAYKLKVLAGDGHDRSPGEDEVVDVRDAEDPSRTERS